MSSRTAQGVVNMVGHRLVFHGTFGLAQLPSALTALRALLQAHFLVELDFSGAAGAFPGPMLSLICELDRVRDAHAFHVALPHEGRFRRLFLNANWATLIDPMGGYQSGVSFIKHMPATRFESAEQQQAALNRALDILLTSVRSLRRADFSALEWALGEVMDNVLTHSQSRAGGLVQVSTLASRVQFVVCDSGLSIPATLREAYPMVRDDAEALGLAIQEGVTRDKSLGQGNGLFGTFGICQASEGQLHIRSGAGNLHFTPTGGLHAATESCRLNGTLVDVSVSAEAGLLGQSLRFSGTVYRPTDNLELATLDRDELVIEPRRYVSSLFSRPAAISLRNALANLNSMLSSEVVIVVDLSNIELLSSSFADEAFAKLCVQLGRAHFERRFRFRNARETVRQLIARSLRQRVALR